MLLTANWTLSFTHPVTRLPAQIPATVPGNVEIDLVRAGLIVDPFPQDDVNALRPWQQVDDWRYETQFDAPDFAPDAGCELVFEGIDTIADVALNHENILRCENMFLEYRMDVKDRLKPRANTLSVRIYSIDLFARRFPWFPNQVAAQTHRVRAHIRKAACMWGWDNAPRVVAAGIWKPVYLQPISPIRFSDVYVFTKKVYPEKSVVGVHWHIETPDIDISGYRLEILFEENGGTVQRLELDVDFIHGQTYLTLENPSLWWPYGYGKPVLHTVRLTLRKDGCVLAEWQTLYGIREIELKRTSIMDGNGGGEFIFRCNGKNIYCRGTNWKPLDPLPSRAPGKMQRALELLSDLHCNMVRVWGGGMYEDRSFYDYCDRHGILVWQDFMQANMVPPQDEAFQEIMAAEAEHIIRRLRNHTSIALWCGDNEIDLIFLSDTPPSMLPSENVISRKVLKSAVAANDPYRPYVESSPYVDDEIITGLGLEKYATNRAYSMQPSIHFAPAEEEDYRRACRAVRGRFIAELNRLVSFSEDKAIFGRELDRMKRVWELSLDSSGTRYKADFFQGVDDPRHQVDNYFAKLLGLMMRRAHAFFGRPFDLNAPDDLVLANNTFLADRAKFVVEYFRANKWDKTGVLWWSLLDMHPMAFQFSAVDSNFCKKKHYYWLRQSQQPVCVIACESKDEARVGLYICNDTLESVEGSCRVHEITAGNERKEILSEKFAAASNCSVLLGNVEELKSKSLFIIEWTIDGTTSFNHYLGGKPPYDFETLKVWNSHLDKLYK
jgi:beta-mannosidase